ncbi:MAG: VWA domain-containing protein [Rhodothermaceae bacterium]|nr:VWA domain-containing protein [Rhodothermaceae bacterium]
MSFRTPEALWLLLLIPAAVALYVYAAQRRQEALRLFFGGRDAPELDRATQIARVRRWQAALLTVGLTLLIGAAAGPRYGTALREAQQESLDLVVALDVSASMRAEDVAPDRLQRAKLAIARLAEQRRSDRMGLVVFAGDAFVQCPLTSDRAAFRLFLDAAGPDLIPTPGTDFGRALTVAGEAFADDESGLPRSRAILVVSDGEDHEGGLDSAIDALHDDGVALLSAGVGTDAGGPIPIYRGGQIVEYKMSAGERVITTLEEGVLREIAGRSGFVRIGTQDDGVAALSDQLDRLERTVGATEQFEAYAERFQWPLALGLLFLFAERLLALRGTPTRVPEPA